MERYYVRLVPPVIAQFANIKEDGILTKSQILSQLGISAYLEGFDYDYNISINDYRIRILKKGIIVYDNTFSNSPQFSDDIKKHFNELVSGDELLFSDMKILYNRLSTNQSISKELFQSTQNPYIRIVVK